MVYLFAPLPALVKPAERHQSFLTITTCISICWPQMSRRAMVWLHSERECLRKEGSRDRRPWGHCLEICYQHRAQPCQHQVTHSYRDTQTRAGRTVWAVAASAAPARLPLSLLHCLLVVQNTDREESKISHFSLNFQIAKIYMEILYACKSFKCDLGWKISLLIQ